MKINSHDNQLPQIRQAENVQKSPEAARGAKGPDVAVRGDDVRISGRAREAARIAAEVRKVPDVRQERVRELKEAVEAGTYRVSGADVAEKMIREQVLGTIL